MGRIAGRKRLHDRRREAVPLNWFVNYVRYPDRPSSLNLAVARVILCSYAAWKLALFPFSSVPAIPAALYAGNPLSFFPCLRWGHPAAFVVEQAIGVVALACCVCGLFPRLTSFVAALVLTHLSGVSFAAVNEKTFLPIAYFLIFLGIDGGRRRAPDGGQIDATTTACRLEPLRWLLLALALIYFFTGYCKVRGGGWTLPWASPENQARLLLHVAAVRGIPVASEAGILFDNPWMLRITGLVTLALELGFLPAVLAGWSITPFIVGLAGMHLAILFTMDVDYFSSMAVLYAAFFAWDRLAERVSLVRRALAAFAVPRSRR